MKKAQKRLAIRKKAKAVLSDRGRILLKKILGRREELRERTGRLSDSVDLIREEREQRY